MIQKKKKKLLAATGAEKEKGTLRGVIAKKVFSGGNKGGTREGSPRYI